MAGRLDEIKKVALVHYKTAHDSEAAFAAVASDVIYHGPAGSPKTLAAWRARHDRFLAAFNDIETVIHNVVAEGDLVFVHWSTTVTHRAPFLGIPATNKRIMMSGVGIDRVRGDRVVEHWGLQDMMGVVAQIGGTPTPEPPRVAA